MGIAKDSIESLKLKARISDFVLASTSGKLRGNKGMAICPRFSGGSRRKIRI